MVQCTCRQVIPTDGIPYQRAGWAADLWTVSCETDVRISSWVNSLDIVFNLEELV